jgi:hypothetical protein
MTKTPKKAPNARPRSERRQHVLELLSVDQPRTTEELAYFTGIPLSAMASVLIGMDRSRLVRRVIRGRGRGKIRPDQDPGPSSWALRCWPASGRVGRISRNENCPSVGATE